MRSNVSSVRFYNIYTAFTIKSLRKIFTFFRTYGTGFTSSVLVTTTSNIRHNRRIDDVSHRICRTHCGQNGNLKLSTDYITKLILKYLAKSCSLDPWPTTLLKYCAVAPSVTKLVNFLLLNGVVPESFNKAHHS